MNYYINPLKEQLQLFPGRRLRYESVTVKSEADGNYHNKILIMTPKLADPRETDKDRDGGVYMGDCLQSHSVCWQLVPTLAENILFYFDFDERYTWVGLSIQQE